MILESKRQILKGLASKGSVVRPSVDRRSRQAPQRAATKQLADITERLAGRVKGLTARFDVLLLTVPAPDQAGDKQNQSNNG